MRHYDMLKDVRLIFNKDKMIKQSKQWNANIH